MLISIPFPCLRGLSWSELSATASGRRRAAPPARNLRREPPETSDGASPRRRRLKATAARCLASGEAWRSSPRGFSLPSELRDKNYQWSVYCMIAPSGTALGFGRIHPPSCLIQTGIRSTGWWTRNWIHSLHHVIHFQDDCREVSRKNRENPTIIGA